MLKKRKFSDLTTNATVIINKGNIEEIKTRTKKYLDENFDVINEIVSKLLKNEEFNEIRCIWTISDGWKKVTGLQSEIGDEDAF